MAMTTRSRSAESFGYANLPTAFVIVHREDVGCLAAWMVDRLVEQQKSGPLCAIESDGPLTNNRIWT